MITSWFAQEPKFGSTKMFQYFKYQERTAIKELQLNLKLGADF